MAIWAIADLHLSFGVSNKSMDLFGDQWVNHPEKVAKNWREKISPDDLVLIPGDISWAMSLEQVVPDLQWIDNLPGTKVMIKGNHDYWWSSINKIEKILPPSIHLIQNNVFVWNDVVVGGARLWDSSEYGFNSIIEFSKDSKMPTPEDPVETEKIFVRELGRLEMSLQSFKNYPEKRKLVMTHYPPVGLDLQNSRASAILEKYGTEVCTFGHLHSVKAASGLFGKKAGVTYLLTACDYLNFDPLRII